MTRSLPVTRCRRSRGRRPVSPGWRPGQPCRSWTPGSPCARHVRGWSPGASRWPATSVRRTPGRATGAARSQDGAIPSRRCWWSGSRLQRTAATAPGRIFTGDRSGDWLFASLHRVGLANQPTSVHAGDGLQLIGTRLVAAVRCAPPQNQPTPAERDTCAPWIERELGLVLPSVRAVVCLGGFGWEAALRALASAGVTVPRPRPKFGHAVEVELSGPGAGAAHPARLLPPLAAEHVHRQADRADARRRPGPGGCSGRLAAVTLPAITAGPRYPNRQRKRS